MSAFVEWTTVSDVKLNISSPWQPLQPNDVATLMRGAKFFWCIAGGFAVERFVGRSFREHADMDVVVLRSQQQSVRAWLQGEWRLCAADPPGNLRRWMPGTSLSPQAHDVWCHRHGENVWRLQLMIQDADETSWAFRHDARVTGPIEELAVRIGAIPFLRLDLQLLYKSREPRSKDDLDFQAALPFLDLTQRRNLVTWLRETNPEGHRWIGQLVS